MELLKQSTGHARQVIASMPPAARAVVIVLLAVVLGGSTVLLTSSSPTQHEPLFGGRQLVDHELDAIELAFSRAGLNDWRREGRQIRIPGERRAEYLATLNDTSALPFTLRNPMKEAMESSNLFDSASLRDAREMLAKEQDLGLKISAFPEVQWASVEYDEGESRGLASVRQRSASVLVIPENNVPLSRNRIKSIEQLVRGSFAGLDVEDIVVIDTNATFDDAVDHEDPLSRKQKEAEVRIEQKLRDLLVGFPAKIAVSAQIDPTMDVQRAVLRVESDSVHLVKPRTLVDVFNEGQDLLGIASEPASVIGKRSVSIDSKEQSISAENGQTVVQDQMYESTRLAALQVKSVRVSVGIPTSYYEQLFVQEYSRQNPNALPDEVPAITEADLETLRTKTENVLQTAITVLLPEVHSGQSHEPQVEVWDYIDFPSQGISRQQKADTLVEWLSESWGTLLVVSLSVFILWSAFGFLRSHRTRKNANDSLSKPIGEVRARSMQNHERDRQSSGEELSVESHRIEQELSASFESDPEAGANVIRQWIRQAA